MKTVNISILLILVVVAGCKSRQDIEINIDLNMEKGVSYIDIESKNDYRNKLDEYNSNSWIIRLFCRRPKIPSPIIMNDYLFAIYNDQKLKIYPGNNQIQFTGQLNKKLLIGDKSVEYELFYINKNNLTITIDNNSVISY